MWNTLKNSFSLFLIFIGTRFKQAFSVAIACLRGQTSLYPASVRQLEKLYAKHTKTEHAMMFSNATSAMEAALFATGVNEKSIVATSALVIPSSYCPAYNLGASLKFIDIDPQTLNLSENQLEKLGDEITHLIVVHYYGLPVNMRRVMKWARKKNVRVIEDCSHAHGAEFDKQVVGSFGDVGIFSLQGAKAVSAGEGGIAVTNDSQLAIKMAAYGHQRNYTKFKIDGDRSEIPPFGYGRKMRAHPLGANLALVDLQILDFKNHVFSQCFSRVHNLAKALKIFRLQEMQSDAKMGGYCQGVALIFESHALAKYFVENAKKMEVSCFQRDYRPDIEFFSSRSDPDSGLNIFSDLPVTAEALGRVVYLGFQQFVSPFRWVAFKKCLIKTAMSVGTQDKTLKARAEREVFDVAVIGSGPSGAFAAYQLAEYGLKVCVVEAGSKPMDTDPSNIYDEYRSQIRGRIDFGFSQQLGGTSNLWAGGLARFCEVDLVRRDQFNFPGWSLSINELNELYQRVETLMGIDNEHFKEKKSLKSLNDIEKRTALESRDMLLMKKAFRSQSLIQNRPNIDVFENLVVNRLNYAEKENRINSISCKEQESLVDVEIKAKCFVLASGAISNIRLLLHSFKPYKNLFSKWYSQIGLYFSTHPKANVGYLKMERALDTKHPFFLLSNFRNYSRRFQFGLNKDFLLEQNLLNHCVRFDSVLNRKMTKILDKMRSILGRVPLVGRGKGPITELAVKMGIVAFRIIDSVGFIGSKNQKIVVRAFLDQAAREENHVRLSPKQSKWGLPLAELHWKYSDEDWSETERFFRTFSSEIEKAGIGKLSYEKPKGNEFVGVHSHFMGGTRMGHDEKNSVVDYNLKAHKVDNLYIAGPSVFPSFGYTNPFLTISAMSLRLADHLSMLFIKDKKVINE